MCLCECEGEDVINTGIKITRGSWQRLKIMSNLHQMQRPAMWAQIAHSYYFLPVSIFWIQMSPLSTILTTPYSEYPDDKSFLWGSCIYPVFHLLCFFIIYLLIYSFWGIFHTFAHPNVLSGCCYRYPRVAQRGGRRQRLRESEKRKLMRRRCSRMAASETIESLEKVKHRGCRTRGGGNNNPAGSELSKVRECVKSEKRGW